MIRLNNISKVYTLDKAPKVQAVTEVNLEIQAGDFVVITGRSGSGKTTLLNLMSGLTPPTSGKVYLDGIDLWSISDNQRAHLRNQKLGFVFQFPSLLPGLTTLDNVALPTIFSSNGVKETGYDRAAELLEIVGLDDKFGAMPRQLSAGQQQRVVVARALLNEPQLLLADEPTSDLDEQTEHEIMELFQDIHRRTGVTIVMVTHSSQLVSYGTRSVQMASGKVILDELVTSIQSN